MNETIDKIIHAEYVKKLKKQKRYIVTAQILLLIIFIVLWQVASNLDWINPLIFSSPEKVLLLMSEKLQDGTLLLHLRYTIFETIFGFILGTVGGIILASLLWSSTRLARIVDPYLVVLNAMPKVALGPMIIVALGPGFISIIMMGAIISIIITTIVIYTAFKEIDPHYVHLLKSFGATRWECFKEAIFPATIPTMVSTLKVNVGLSWVGVIVGEFLVSNQGLGYLIIYGFQVFDFTLVMSSLVVIAILAAVMYIIIEKLEKRLLRGLK